MTLKVIVLLGVLVVAILAKLPVFLSLALSVCSYALCFPDSMYLEVLGQGLVTGLNNYSYAGVLFFFLSGEIMSKGGISNRIIRFFRACIGHIRGGLSHVNVLDSLVFAGVSGSALADTAATGAVIIPAMKEEGYPAEYAVGITIVTSCIGPIIPPSTGLILLAVYTGASVTECLMGGLVPGLFMGAFLLAASLIISKRRNFPKGKWLGWSHLWHEFYSNIFALLLPVFIIVTLGAGIGTVNEVGAITVVYAIIVSCFIYRDLDFKGLLDAVISGAMTCGRMLCILGMAGIFTWIVGSLGLRSALSTLLAPFEESPTLLLFICMLVMFILGMFLDHTIIMYVIAPIIAPAIAAAGIDMVQYCVLTMIVCTMGLITPPVGMLIYIGSSIGNVDPVKVVKEILPFIGALVLCVIVLVLFPSLTTAFPQFLYG